MPGDRRHNEPRRGGRDGGGGPRRKMLGRRKVCRFCADKSTPIDYKDCRVLAHFVTERGKIIPRRITGACARHQRRLTTAIKRAREIAFLPYTTAYD